MSENETSANIHNLQEALTQQQQKITALREMVRKSDGSQQNKLAGGVTTTEKVRNINKKLNQLKAKAKGGHYSSGSETSEANLTLPEKGAEEVDSLSITAAPTIASTTVLTAATTGSEKVLLLRQQMEQNKLRLAQRASSKLHLEQLVTELKEKLDSTQQTLDDTTELGKSMSDLSMYGSFSQATAAPAVAAAAAGGGGGGGGVSNPQTPAATRREQRHRSATDLSTQQAFNLDKERIKFLENRCRLLENKLEKEKQTAAQLDATKQAKVDTNEHLKINKQLEARILELEHELKAKAQEIETKQNENDKLLNELRISHEVNNDELTNLELERLRQENSNFKSRILDLEQLNEQLTATNSDYREKLQQMETQLSESMQNSAKLQANINEMENTAAETLNTSTAEDTESRACLEMAKQIQTLQNLSVELKNENEALKSEIAAKAQLKVDDEQISAKIEALEATVAAQREDLNARQAAVLKLEEELLEKTIELNVLNANFQVLEEKLQNLSKTKSKVLFSTTGNERAADEGVDVDLQAENQQLKQKLDESNKAMIKLKLKCKQFEKENEKLKKTTKIHEELSLAKQANEALQQRIAALEDEKGNWQLQEMENPADDSQQQQTAANLKIKELEEKLEKLQTKQETTPTSERVVIARVEADYDELQMEQQNDEIEKLQKQLAAQMHKCEQLQKEHAEIQHKNVKLEKQLEHYINENMELLDKLEKLSKSSSSAESIEIVERLTQQEQVEFNKQLVRSQSQEHQPTSSQQQLQHVDELTQTEIGYELSDSLVKLREESSELMNKVAMFTAERREVLEKMDQIKTENNQLKANIERLEVEKENLNEKIAESAQLSSKLENELEKLQQEKQQLSSQLAETSMQKSQLSGELSSMQKSTEVIAALDDNAGCANLFEKCEKSLTKLENELEAYKRANDKNAKFNASKKLAKEAKNAHIQLSELLQKVKEASTAVETVTVVETVVAVTAPNGKALAEYEQLTAQNRELKSTVEELRMKVQELEEANVHEQLSELVALKPAASEENSQLENEQKLFKYEAECLALKTTVDELRQQLSELNVENESKTGETKRLQAELSELKKMSSDFESLLKEKDASFEAQAEQFTRLRKELEGKCEVYIGEMEILHTLVAEQKQQLIEAYKEHEHELNLKMLDLQQRDEQITKLRTELTELRQTSRAAGAELNDSLEKECEKLREALRINKALTAEQINELANKQETIDMLNQQIIELYKTMEENTEKVIEKEDEIADLEMKFAGKNDELERLLKDNEEQKSVVDKLLSELHSHKENKQQILQMEHEIQNLAKTKTSLEQANKDLEQKNKEHLEKLKKYAVNLKKRVAECNELKEKLKENETKSTENELQSELTANVVLLNERISDYELKVRTQEAHLTEIQAALQAKTIELLESMENYEKLELDLKAARQELQQRDEAIVQLKNALAASQEQTTATAPSEENETEASWFNDELNEQLNQAQSDLMVAREQLLAKEQAIVELTEKSKQVEEQLQAKSLKFEKSKAVIKERNNQIQRLQIQLKELQEKLNAQPEEIPVEVVKLQTSLTAVQTPPAPAPPIETVPKIEHENLQSAFEALNAKYASEKAAFEKTIERLETLHDGIQAKLQEDMAYIESLEQENTRFKEKICKLENCVASFEERRASMERRVHHMDAQMSQRADEYVKAEDELIYRLNMLSDHDEVIAQRLLESQESKEELQTRLDQLQRKYADLSTQYSKLEKEHKNFQEQSETANESELQKLKQQLAQSQAELQHQRAQYDAKLAVKTSELDELESELSEQLATINAEKRALQTDLEKSQDSCTALKDEIMRLNESLNDVEQAKQESERELTWLRMQSEQTEQQEYELQSLRMQSLQDKTELDNLRQQIENLAANHQAELEAVRHEKNDLENQRRQQLESLTNSHQAELEALRLQIAELDTLRMQVGQNQTDDQVFIESENKRLSDLLQEREAVIAEYQRQNLQLQMAAANAAAAASTTASARAAQPQAPDLFATLGIAAQANPSVVIGPSNFEQQLTEKTHLIASLQRDLENLRESNTELQMELFEKNQQIEALNARAGNANNVSASTSQDVIPAPSLFFAQSNQMAAPSPFDEIVQRRYEQPNMASGFEQQQPMPPPPPTIEDLQRNVSDLEKYNQELEHKIAARHTNEEELRQRLRQSEQQISNLMEQLQLINRRTETDKLHVDGLERLLKERDENLATTTSKERHLELRIEELETTLKTVVEESKQASAQTAEAQMSAWQIAELEQRVIDLEQLLKTNEADKAKLQEQLDEQIKLVAATKNIENQILADNEVEFNRNVAPSLDMFFGNTAATALDFEDVIKPPTLPEVSTVPVVEEPIAPEKAYICHPDGSGAAVAANAPETFDYFAGAGATESWGGDDDHWGAAEAVAEEKHLAQNQTANQTISLLSNEQQLELQLQAANERIKELEQTFANEENQRQKLQEKLAKTLKVVGKYKAQNEELKKKEQTGQSSSAGAGFFDDLDVAIQDELKSQVTRLEAALNEQRKLQQEAAAEKEKLLKRIDVLTAGNERLTEMKERQDMDMEMYKTRINDLQQKLNKLDDWGTGGDGGEPVTANSAEVQATQPANNEQTARIQALLAEIEDLKGDKQELQALLDEERVNVARTEQNLQAQIVELQKGQANQDDLNDANSRLQEELKTLQQGLNEALVENEKLRIENTKAANAAFNIQESKIITELKQQLQTAQAEVENLKEKLKAAELLHTKLEAEIKQLQSELEAAHSNSNSNRNVAGEELIVQLQEKDAEIMHLKQRVEDLMREDQTEKLVLEILTKNQEIHMLKMQVKNLEDDKHELEHNLTLQITKEMQQQKQQTATPAAEEKLNALEKQISELQSEKRQMEEELGVLNAHVMGSLELEDKLKAAALDLDMKNIEIKELRQTLESLKSNASTTQPPTSTTSSTNAEVDVTALNARWESLVEQRCNEIAQMWRTHLEQRENEFQSTEQRLKAEIEALKQQTPAQQHQTAAKQTQAMQPQRSNSMESSNAGSATASSTPVSQVSATSSAETSSADGTPLRIINEADADEIIAKMQTALENQEIEIVSLKEQLAIRSAEYARLAAQYDPFKLQSGAAPINRNVTNSSESNTATVPKSELDLALYMLHQRDMRCEEMTMELVALMEERDILQLKLSNTLRQVETIKNQTNFVEPPSSSGSAEIQIAAATPTSASTTMLDSPAKLTTTTATDDSAVELHQKLTQLQSVNHSKDKIIKEERERRNRQMERIQQDVAKIPTAAVSELIGSDISQTSQTPSSALLNWLWGNKPLSTDESQGSSLN